MRSSAFARVLSVVLIGTLTVPYTSMLSYGATKSIIQNTNVITKPETDEERERREEREREAEKESIAEREEREEELRQLEEELADERSNGSDADQNYIRDLIKDINAIREELGMEKISSTTTSATGPSSGTGEASGPGAIIEDDEEEEEEVVPIKPPTNQQKEEIDDEVGDLVVTDKVYTTAGKTRVTEVYSINNQFADCYYRPKAAEIPLLGDRVCKMGQYTAAYTGFFDIGWKEASKPRGEQSRALEILGYDFLFKEESYDVATKKYSHTLIGTRISQETAIMNIYKALGLEQYDIKMYHTKGSYTKGNSPTGSLLGRDTLVYRIRDCNSSVTDTFEGYETYVFVTRSNPLLYMRKLQNDFNISMESDKSQIMTLEDFIIMVYKMMSFYGEPVLSQQETNQLLQVYGAEVPAGMSSEFEEAWMYLKARGVLNIDNDRLNSNLTKSDMFDILMCVKDRDSRTNYKEVQLTYNLNTDIVNKGYYPVTTTITEVDDINIEGEVSYESCIVYDYLVPINDYSRFLGVTGEELTTQFVSDNPEAANLLLPGSAYVGIVDDMYYHFIIPIDDPAQLNGYYRVDTLGLEDKPGAIMLFDGGGIYKYDNSTGSGKDRINYFKRRPFTDIEYPGYVDKERKSGVNDFDYDSWGGKDNIIYVPVESDDDGPVKPDIDSVWGIDNWMGPWCRDIVTSGNWVQETTTGKWRYYVSDDDAANREYLEGAGYYIGETSSGDIASNLFMFDSDGYMVTGWYQDGHLWAYFDEDGHLVHDTEMTIDGAFYEFDQWGWWIDGEYNIPGDREDDWGYLSNIEGQWVYDETVNNWWFMLPDGNYPLSGVYRINDKFYCFDDEGWMLTGWYEENNAYYYFYPNEGHMAINTTVDGYRVGQNGRAVGEVKMSLGNKIKALYASATSKLGFMTAYADTVAASKNSLGSLVSTGGSKEFRVKIYDGTVVETYDEIQQKVKTADSGARFTKSSSAWSGTPYITILSKLNQERVASLLTFKTNADNLTLVNTQMAITQFGTDKEGDMSILVPFEELVEAGLFMDQVNMSSDNSEIQIWAISSETSNANTGSTNRRNGFGEIRLNKSDNTIMVGPTVYTLRKNQQLWCLVPTSEDIVKAYSFVDKDGNQLKFENQMLYVDLRVVYGWAANEVKFYQMNTSADENITSQKQIVVSAGKVTTTDASGNEVAVEVLQTDVNTNGGSSQTRAWNTARILPNYTADGHHAFLAANSYQLATWALLVANSQTGTEQVDLVTYYPKLAFSQLGVAEPSAEEGVDRLRRILPEGRKILETPDHVCRAYNVQINGIVSKGQALDVGKWYRDKDFGYIYIMPTEDEWKNNNGYKKWLGNEWSTPMISKNLLHSSSVIDMSMPAFDYDGAKYGERRANTTKTKMIPCLSSLSRYLYREPMISTRTLDSARGSSSSGSGVTTESYLFGVHSIIKENNSWKIYGIGANSGQSFRVDEEEVGKLQFLAPIRIYQRRYTGDTNMTQYEIYTSAPSTVTYVEATGEESKVGTVTKLGGNPLAVFRDFDKFTFNNLISWLDEALATVILFAVEFLPLFFFTCSLAVFGIGLMADFKFVQYICNRFFDPIKFLTLGRRDINNVGGIKFFICVLLITVTFALCIDGNIVRIFTWIFTVVGEYLNMLGNI